MPSPQRFAIIFAPETVGQLQTMEPKYHRLIEKIIDGQLSFTPERGTRNRKPLDRSVAFGAAWELCLWAHNRFRVFYEVDSRKRTVRVLAVGVNEGNQLFIGGKEMEL